VYLVYTIRTKENSNETALLCTGHVNKGGDGLMMKIADVWRAASFALLFAFAFAARAQDYPSHPVRIIAPFAAGGGTDAIARFIAQYFAESLKGTFYVDNKPGANGIVGTAAAAKAPADGYTLVLGSTGPNAVNPALRKDLPYDAVKDFTPIAIVATIPNVLVVNAEKVPAKSLDEFVRLARSAPAPLSYGSTGIGSPAHLAAELFCSAEGIRMVHVPYKGAGAAMPDLLAGNVQVMFADLLSALPHIRSGRLRALGITTAKRSVLMPELPTLAEAGVPAYNMGLWYALFAPAGTPANIVRVLNAETGRMLKDPVIVKKLLDQGAEPLPTSVGESEAFVKAEIVRWNEAVQKLGVKVE
jgi:tripartite-type tricarboxylate transporter receptor subunit TctC